LRLLLDTHVALWAVSDHERLPAASHDLISDEANEVFVSVASVWEIAIKHGLPIPRRKISISSEEAVALFRQVGFTLLPISADHATAVETLPPIHGDPFDRLIVAQALTQPLVLLTRDTLVARYSDTIRTV
jgi:PIN domain nuclease of toxin-antitoxin system